jgi:glutamyl-tRNA synthetase
MCNYLGMMGYTLPDQREIFSFQELAETFDIKRISLGGPVFDLAKLKWLNGRYLREQMTEEEVVNRMIEWKLNSNFIQKLIPHALPRLENFSDFIPLSGFLFEEHPNLELSSLVGKTEPNEASKLIKICEWELEKTSPWKRENICEVFQQMALKEEIKLKNMLPLFFQVISGRSVSLPLFDAMEILGQDLVRIRLRKALELLSTEGAGLSKKGLKALEKEYMVKYGDRID